MTAYETYILTLLCISAPCSALYAFFYMFRPWFVTLQGQALAFKSWGSALLLGMGLAATVWPDYPYRDEVRAVAFTIWTVGIVYLFLALVFSPGARRYPPWNWRRKSRRDP